MVRSLFSAVALCLAAGASQVAECGEESAWDRAWSHAVLYENEGEGAIRKIALSGRLHVDAAHFDADQGDWNDALWRRFRFGAKMDLAGNWVAHLEGAFDLEDLDDDYYSRLTDAYLGWKSDNGTSVKLLKHSAGFTLDGATSSKSLLTPQRNNVTRNLWFTAEYFTGVTVSGKLGPHWTGKAAVFSTDGEEEISAFSAGYFGLLSLDRDFSHALDIDQASVRLDYVYNDQHPESNTPDFTHVVSLSSQWQAGAWGLRTDLGGGEGHFGQSDLWGLSVMPYYQFNELIQGVFRYTYLDSRDANGLRLGRYEDRIVDGRGDKYNEFFGGVNFFFYGHKFKWQTGLQYTTMDDSARDGGEYDGWGITTVLRTYW